MDFFIDAGAAHRGMTTVIDKINPYPKFSLLMPGTQSLGRRDFADVT